VASLRTAGSRYPDDPDLARFIEELRSGSAEFDLLWRQARSGVWKSAVKTVHHPEVGPLTLDCDTLLVPETDQSVVVYSAASGTAAAAALDLLRVTGAQRFTPTR
jgi:hypothetical protein